MPYNGLLIYIPQKKGWIFWNDIILYSQLYSYPEDILACIVSERACADWLREKILANMEYTERQNKKKAFQKANPIRYINIEIIDE